MTEPFLGQIIQGGWNFAPRSYALCAGQLMSISQNTALFSLLGTTFGGDGVSTFGLPNLQGRTAIGTGQLAGGGNYVWGQLAGSESTTLLTSNLPPHTHSATFTPSNGTFNASSAKSTSQTPIADGTIGITVDGATPPAGQIKMYVPAGTGTPVALSGVNAAGTVAVGPTGSGLPISILQPYLAVTTVIALQGIFPSRN